MLVGNWPRDMLRGRLLTLALVSLLVTPPLLLFPNFHHQNQRKSISISVLGMTSILGVKQTSSLFMLSFTSWVWPLRGNLWSTAELFSLWQIIISRPRARAHTFQQNLNRLTPQHYCLYTVFGEWIVAWGLSWHSKDQLISKLVIYPWLQLFTGWDIWLKVFSGSMTHYEKEHFPLVILDLD